MPSSDMRFGTLRNGVRELVGFLVIGAITLDRNLLEAYYQRDPKIQKLERFVMETALSSPRSRVPQEIVYTYHSVCQDLYDALGALATRWTANVR